MSKLPLAVLISDVHYSLSTLHLADAAMNQAISKANTLDIPLIVAGDLHDTKANLRGECVNAMLSTFSKLDVDCYVLVGNHDLINEKSKENSIEFLNNYQDCVTLVKDTGIVYGSDLTLIPYFSDMVELRKVLTSVNKESIVIMHQGLEGSHAGDYIQDKTALQKQDVQDLRVISGHYHHRQDIKTGRPRVGGKGLWSYIGNPYTLNFGEAADPEKGYQVLYSDGTLEHVPTGLRKHMVITVRENADAPLAQCSPNDLILVKAIGRKEWLSTLTKQDIKIQLGLASANLRLELIPEETAVTAGPVTFTSEELLDSIIEKQALSAEAKDRLKITWRLLCT